MSTPTPNNWYAIFTRPRAEKKVYQRFIDLGYTAYLPLVTTLKQWSDRKKKVKTPLISSYVFIQIDEQYIYDVLNVPSTLGVLKYLGKLAIVRNEEIENLKLLLNNKDAIQIVEKANFSKDEEVEVIRGPLAGLKAFYVEEKGKHRVLIKIDALDRYFAAEIPLSFIKKIKSTAA